MKQYQSPTAGLIPARAGSTSCVLSEGAGAGAHPRPCGEHGFGAAFLGFTLGSSPPVRGARHDGAPLMVCSGLIPARAGSTRNATHRWGNRRAHPRPCGEHYHKLHFRTVNKGSSPPVRGAQQHRLEPGQQGGLIPARAGSTLADMGFYPLYRQNRITLEPEPPSRIHDKQLLLTPTSTAIPTRLTPPRLRHNFTNHRTIN